MSSQLDSIVSVSITAAISSLTRAGFGVPLLASWFPTSVWPDRARTYTDLADMTDDGFLATDPAYIMASQLKSQNPSISSWKVGRRASPPVQSVRITPTVTTEGTILEFTIEGTEISYEVLAGASVASICTALVALVNAVVGVVAADDTTHITITSNRKTSVRVTVTTPANSENFTVIAEGVSYTYASDTDATKTEIRDGLEALLDAAGYTATDVSTDAIDIATATHRGTEFAVSDGATGVLTLSAAVTANQLFSIGEFSSGLKVEDLTPDPGLATDLSAIEAADGEWYGLAIDSWGEAEISAGSTWANARTVLFAPTTIDSDTKDAGVTDDIGSALLALSHGRTHLMLGNVNMQYASLTMMGNQFPYDPGSTTWAYKTLVGVSASTTTGAERAALATKRVNYVTSINAVPVTIEGWVSKAGSFADLVHGTDWFQARLQERFFSLLITNGKIPYTDASVDLVRAEIAAQLQDGQAVNFIAPNTEDTPWIITAPAVADVDAADRAARLLPDITFSAYYAGAMHKFQMQGTLSV